MSITNLICPKQPPCAQCPYTLGLVETLRDPCPECKLNNYQMYEIFQQRRYMGNPGSTDTER